ncbi:MAG TPA: S8 family serine peptidase [bacterium]|nr:S8 family serine peptidase [bacterium]
MKEIHSIILVCLCLLISGFGVAADDTVTAGFGTRADESGWRGEADVNNDGIIDGYDLAFRALNSGDAVTDKTSATYRADRILVRCVPRLGRDEIQRMVGQYGVNTDRVRSLGTTGYTAVPVPEGMTAEQFLETMRTDRSVMDVQFDYICRASRTPNDQYYDIQWNFRHVKAPRAWDLTSGGNSDVVVAIIDTGIAYENYGTFEKAPDFAGTAFTNGYDFINNDAHANDDEGHGTHVAGTVAETTNNSIGAAGLAYQCTLMPVKVLGSNGSGTSSSLGQGIRWAADHGAHVINMSLGFPTGTDGGPVVREAVQYAYAKGVILVGAAGNERNDKGYSGGVEYPAAYDECIAVGAIRYDKRYTNYSNYGSALTCVAPGGKVGFDQNNDGHSDGILQQTFIDGDPTKFRYVYYEGTSSASPHVAAAAALFVSRHGGGPAEFRQAVIETSEDLGPSGFDQDYGYGLIDISKIVLRGRGWGAN